MKAEVTVITPAYNAASYIEKTIQSVIRQTIPCKMIIVNDASNDATQVIAERCRQQYPDRIEIIENRRNMGVAASRNAAIRKAVTEYIAFLDADDWWSPEKLELQLEVLNRLGADACYSGRELMCADGDSTGKIIQVPERINYKLLLRGNVISCSSVLMRRDDALSYPMEHDELHEDYIVWLKMLRDGKNFAGINKPLLKSRLGAEGKSRNKLKSAKMTYGVYRYLGVPIWQAGYYFCCYAWNGFRKYAGKRD